MQDDALGLDAVQRRGDVGQHADIEDQDVTGPDALGRDLLGGHGRAVEPAAGIAANLAAWFMIGASQGTLLGPSESRLMQEHGIARETARKAVRVLVDEGLVYVVQGRGAYVTKR